MHSPELPPQAALCQLVAAAADLCRKPLRHAVVPTPGSELHASAGTDCSLRLEVREAGGARCPELDLELEIYVSADQLNLTMAWLQDPERPMLWHGSHPVWMAADTGNRCASPRDGEALEGLARRLRALLAGSTNS